MAMRTDVDGSRVENTAIDAVLSRFRSMVYQPPAISVWSLTNRPLKDLPALTRVQMWPLLSSRTDTEGVTPMVTELLMPVEERAWYVVAIAGLTLKLKWPPLLVRTLAIWVGADWPYGHAWI